MGWRRSICNLANKLRVTEEKEEAGEQDARCGHWPNCSVAYDPRRKQCKLSLPIPGHCTLWGDKCNWDKNVFLLPK